MSDKFPKLMHFCFLGYDGPLPKKWLDNFNKWTKLNPEYKFKLWNKQDCLDLLKTKHNYFLKHYNKYEYNIQRADSIRYFILYEFGGIYCDLDIEPIYPIKTLIQLYEVDPMFEVLLAENVNLTNNKPSNYFMVSKKKINFWKIVIKKMIKNVDNFYLGKHLTVMNTTGPILLSDIITKKKYDNVIIISKNILDNCTVCGECNSTFRYIKNNYKSSWHSLDSKLLNFIQCNLYISLSILLSSLFIIWLYTKFIYFAYKEKKFILGAFTLYLILLIILFVLGYRSKYLKKIKNLKLSKVKKKIYHKVTRW